MLALVEIPSETLDEALARHSSGEFGLATKRALTRNIRAIEQKQGRVTSFYYSPSVGPELGVFRVETYINHTCSNRTFVSLLGTDGLDILSTWPRFPLRESGPNMFRLQERVGAATQHTSSYLMGYLNRIGTNSVHVTTSRSF